METLLFYGVGAIARVALLCFPHHGRSRLHLCQGAYSFLPSAASPQRK